MIHFKCCHCDKDINGLTIIVDKTHFLHKGCEPAFNAAKAIKIVDVDGVIVECTEDGNRCSCYIKEHDMYFSAKIGDIETINKKTRHMIKAKEKFLLDYPEYK